MTGGQPGPSGARQGLVRRLLDRFGHLIHEVGKFGIVGGVSYLVDFLLFNLAVYAWGFEQLAGKTFSTAIAATVAFAGNRFWTWRHRERSGMAREYSLYFLFNAVGLGIALACLAVSHYGLGSIWPRAFRSVAADNISANLVGTVLGTLFRFWSYRRFVFVGPAAQDAPDIITKGD